MSMDGICDKSGQTNFLSPLAAIIVARRRCMLATWRCGRSTGISAH